MEKISRGVSPPIISLIKCRLSDVGRENQRARKGRTKDIADVSRTLSFLSGSKTFDGALLFNCNRPDGATSLAAGSFGPMDLKALNRFRQFFEIDRFGEKTRGAFVKCLPNATDRRIGCHHNDFDSRLALGE